jgi:hypothetical protein
MQNFLEYNYTINYIYSSTIFGININIIAGLFLLAITLFLLWRKKTDSFFWAVVCLSLPFYMLSFYCYTSELFFTKNYLPLNMEDRRMMRLCLIDQKQNMHGYLCGVSHMVDSVRKNVPKNSKIQLTLDSGYNTYFSYFLYPDYVIAGESEYMVVYGSPNYNYDMRTKILFKRDDASKMVPIGKFDVITNMGANNLLLKKI